MYPAHFSLDKVIRPNVLALPKYSTSTSDELKPRSEILLDANENALGPCLAPPSKSCTPGYSNTNDILGYAFASTNSIHRYPSASQSQLKGKIAEASSKYGDTGVTRECVCLGVGAADIIDLILRVTCRPGVDGILITPPTFGLYKVRAALNDIDVVSCSLDEKFSLRMDEMHQTLTENQHIKLVFIASPGNPTGSLVDLESIKSILELSCFTGIVVVDEAYIDFCQASDKATALNLLSKYDNLIVVQSLSKGAGLAGLRLGMAFSNPTTITMLDKVQMPYCISTLTSKLALAALSPASEIVRRKLLSLGIHNREALLKTLATPHMTGLGVGRPLGRNDANFIMIPIFNTELKARDSTRAQRVTAMLQQEHGIAVRYVGDMPHCEGCVRITVGAEHENKELASCLEKVLMVV